MDTGSAQRSAERCTDSIRWWAESAGLCYHPDTQAKPARKLTWLDLLFALYWIDEMVLREGSEVAVPDGLDLGCCRWQAISSCIRYSWAYMARPFHDSCRPYYDVGIE
jgi:hypothetical protein